MNENTYSKLTCAEIQEDLSRNMAFRRRHEKPLMNWWLFVFLSMLTFGVAALAIVIIRILRVDMYLKRKREYYALVADYTSKRIEKSKSRYNELDMREMTQFADDFARRVRPIGAFFTFFMCIITLGLFVLFYIYRMNRVWYDAQNEEIKFNTLLSRIWTSTGISNEPVPFSCVDKLARNYLLYMLLGIVTCGVWFIVWDYMTHIAPDTYFISVHSTENVVTRTIFDEPC